MGCSAGLAYIVKSSVFTASSMLISNTTLQLSGPDAVIDANPRRKFRDSERDRSAEIRPGSWTE